MNNIAIDLPQSEKKLGIWWFIFYGIYLTILSFLLYSCNKCQINNEEIIQNVKI